MSASFLAASFLPRVRDANFTSIKLDQSTAGVPQFLSSQTRAAKWCELRNWNTNLAAACERLASCIMCGRQWPRRQGCGRLDCAALRAARDQAIDVVDAGRKNDPVDRNEQRERDRNCGGCHWRDRVRGAQNAMHEPWLTPAFGDYPSGNDRHKADPPAVRGDAQIPTRLEQDAPPHQPGADQRCRDHEEAGRQHDPEGEENGHYRWALLRWHFLQPEELAVETMGQDQRRALRDRDREAVFFSLLVRPCKHMEVAAAKRVPMRLHGGDLDGLMLEGIEPVQVTEQNLQWCEKSEQPDR